MTAEPLITWNLFATPSLIAVLAYFIKKWIDDTQKQAEGRNANTISELAAIKLCLTSIKIDMENKMERTDCEKKGNEKWNVIYHHKHTSEGEVVVPQ